MTPRKRGSLSIALTLFALTAVLVFITAAGSMPLWWTVVAGLALVGTGIGAYAEFHRHQK